MTMAEGGPQPEGKTVLIVDGDRDMRHLLEEQLTTLGYRAVAVERLDAAQDRLHEDEIDAVLLEAQLPDGSGLSILPEIKSGSAAPAVVMVTSMRSEEVVVEALRGGADDYLRKPLDLDELGRVVAEAIERRERALTAREQAHQAADDLAEAAVVQVRLQRLDLPELTGWRAATRMSAARVTAGDMYGGVHDGDELRVWVGDISGKGMGAALLSASVGTVIHNQVHRVSDVGVALSRAASLAYPALAAAGGFLTVCLVSINTNTGNACVADAGHGHVRLRRAGGRWETLESPSGYPIGIEPDPTYLAGSFTIERGDQLVIYTDGLVELGEQPDCLAGTRQLVDSVDSAAMDGADAIGEAVFGAVEHVTQTDDRTLLVVERLIGAGPVESTLAVDVSELGAVSELVNRLALAAAVDAATTYGVELALTEAFTNVVRHAYPGNGSVGRDVRLSLSADRGWLTCTLEDGGIAFDPTVARPAPGPDQLGGRGLPVIAATIEDVTYERRDGRNILRLRKQLSGSIHKIGPEDT